MRKAIRGVREAAARGAQIVCLQELFRASTSARREDHGYFELAEPIPGPDHRRRSARWRRSTAW